MNGTITNRTERTLALLLHTVQTARPTLSKLTLDPSHYEYAIESAYAVKMYDRQLGFVFLSERQWLVKDMDGNLWSSYGETRAEAVEHLIMTDVMRVA